VSRVLFKYGENPGAFQAKAGNSQHTDFIISGTIQGLLFLKVIGDFVMRAKII
jgi:hypothetical protein